MAGKEALVHRNVLHADGRRVQHAVNDPIQQQERIPMGDVVHDALDVDQLDRLAGCGRHSFSFIHGIQSTSEFGFASRALF